MSVRGDSVSVYGFLPAEVYVVQVRRDCNLAMWSPRISLTIPGRPCSPEITKVSWKSASILRVHWSVDNDAKTYKYKLSFHSDDGSKLAEVERLTSTSWSGCIPAAAKDISLLSLSADEKASSDPTSASIPPFTSPSPSPSPPPEKRAPSPEPSPPPEKKAPPPVPPPPKEKSPSPEPPSSCEDDDCDVADSRPSSPIPEEPADAAPKDPLSAPPANPASQAPEQSTPIIPSNPESTGPANTENPVPEEPTPSNPLPEDPASAKPDDLPPFGGPSAVGPDDSASESEEDSGPEDAEDSAALLRQNAAFRAELLSTSKATQPKRLKHTEGLSDLEDEESQPSEGACSDSESVGSGDDDVLEDDADEEGDGDGEEDYDYQPGPEDEFDALIWQLGRENEVWRSFRLRFL